MVKERTESTLGSPRTPADRDWHTWSNIDPPAAKANELVIESFMLNILSEN